MAQNGYFHHFATITYNGMTATDISKRVKVLESVLANPYTYYPYDVKQGEQPDTISQKYYDDPYFSWLIYLANKIIDPVYGWYLSTEDLLAFIIQKYGSLPLAESKVNFWRLNWGTDQTILSQADYDALAANLTKYWQPVYAPGVKTTYVRSEDDWKITTNEIKSLVFSNTSSFSPGDLLTFYLTGNAIGSAEILKISGNSAGNNFVYKNPIGLTDRYISFSVSSTYTNGEAAVLYSNGVAVASDGVVMSVDASTIIVRTNLSSDFTLVDHVSGLSSGANSIVVGSLSRSSYVGGLKTQANLYFTSVSSLTQAIPDAELRFWEPVTASDDESEVNDQNRAIILVDKSYSVLAARDLKKAVR